LYTKIFQATFSDYCRIKIIKNFNYEPGNRISMKLLLRRTLLRYIPELQRTSAVKLRWVNENKAKAYIVL